VTILANLTAVASQDCPEATTHTT